MRLLERSSANQFRFTKNFLGDEEVPPYAILSHTWKDDQEVTFDDLLSDTGKSKLGYEKIQFCALQAKRDGLHYFWVDTCCINKGNNQELQHAINSMFRWYQDAAICYVHLSDVSISRDGGSSVSFDSVWESAFRKSRWFTRGWTLQELLAPRVIKFFSREGEHLGDKITLEREIHEITGIPILALRGTHLSNFSVEERFSWQNGRQTTHEEDKVYSLHGIFDIYMLPIYGEGEKNAFKRLRRKIEKSSNDVLPHRASPRLNEFHGTAAAPWIVPFPRLLSFGGRELQLAQVSAHISSAGGQRLAICGLGGSGKTALALESAYRIKEQQPTCAVFWVPAINQDSFEQAYRDICMALRIITDDNADVKRLLKMRLSDENFGQWLMIVDNADDDTVLFGTAGEDDAADRLIDYIPFSRRGSIVFTTRTREAAVRLAENNVILLGKLEKLEGKEVLGKRLLPGYPLEDDAIVDEFLRMLTFLPLAIVQAVAFINEHEITISQYMACYKASEENTTNLLSRDFEDQRRYRGMKNPVSTTWHISFEQIRKRNELAVDYLSFMACIGHSDIPASLLPDQSSQLEQLEAIGTLKAYAFIIERKSHGHHQVAQAEPLLITSFDVHPLVHIAMQAWLKEHNQWTIWVERTMACLVEAVPYGNHDTRKVWTSYLPHAVHVTAFPEAYEATDRVLLLDRIGGCELALGRYKAAEGSYRQALERNEKMLGNEHQDTLCYKRLVGLALKEQGKYTDAETLLRRTLDIEQVLLGKENQDTLTTMTYLADAVRHQGRYVGAEELNRETLGLKEKVLGKEHPDTLRTMNNLASTLYYQKRYSDAEELHRETLALKDKVLGKDHPDTLRTMNNLASTLYYEKRYSDAEELHRETLALYEKVLGKEHPHTLLSIEHLAYILSERDQNDDALSLYKQAYTGYCDVLGPDHLNSQRCLDSYINVQQRADSSLSGSEEHGSSDTTSAPTQSSPQSPNETEVAASASFRHELRQRLKKLKLKNKT
jgi:tetratricopeptide (TPR) repeat protein